MRSALWASHRVAWSDWETFPILATYQIFGIIPLTAGIAFVKVCALLDCSIGTQGPEHLGRVSSCPFWDRQWMHSSLCRVSGGFIKIMTVVVIDGENSEPLLVNFTALWREVTLKQAVQK